MTPDPHNPKALTPNSYMEKARTPAKTDRNGGNGIGYKKLDFGRVPSARENTKKAVKINPSRPLYKLRDPMPQPE